MGNNNATASVTEEESSKSPFEPVSLETTQNHLLLANEGKGGDGDIEKERLLDGIGTPETEPRTEELVEDLQVKKVEEDTHQSGLESLGMETAEQLQKQTSLAKGVETVVEGKEVEDLSTTGNGSVVSKLITTEFGNKEKPCVIDENVIATQRIDETDGIEEVVINESLEEIVPAEEVVKLDQETGMEQKTEFSKIKPGEILNLDYHAVDEDDEVTNEVKADQEISKPGSQETSTVQKTGLEVYKEEKDMESGSGASLKRMIRCRSLPVSHSITVMGNPMAQELVAFPTRNKIGLEKPNTSETLLVSCVESNESQETTEATTDSNKEPKVEILSSSFGNDLKIDESTEKTPLLCEDKTETYEATIAVEEKTVMLERSETDKTRGIELSLGLSMKPSERSDPDDSFKEVKDTCDNIVDKKASLPSVKGKVRKRSKSLLLGTCLCCNAAMN